MNPDTFGEWLKQRRKKLDLTQEALANLVGCSLSAIRKIEKDERRPSKQIAELLAVHLDIPPEDRTIFLKIARGESSVQHLGSTSEIRKRAEKLKSAVERHVDLNKINATMKFEMMETIFKQIIE